MQKNWGYFLMLQFFFFDFLSMKIIIKKVFSSSWFFFINTSFLINFLGGKIVLNIKATFQCPGIFITPGNLFGFVDWFVLSVVK